MPIVLARDVAEAIRLRRSFYTHARSAVSRAMYLNNEQMRLAARTGALRTDYPGYHTVYVIRSYGLNIAANLINLYPREVGRRWVLMNKGAWSRTTRKYIGIVEQVAHEEGAELVRIDDTQHLIPALIGGMKEGLFGELYMEGDLPQIAPALHV